MYLAFVFLGDTSHEVIQFGAPATREMCPCCRDLWGLLILHCCVQKYLIYVLVYIYIYTRYPKLLSHPTLHIWVRNVCCAPSSNICYISWSLESRCWFLDPHGLMKLWKAVNPEPNTPSLQTRNWYPTVPGFMASYLGYGWIGSPIAYLYIYSIYIYML